MQGLASEEFRRQYKQYMDAFFLPGRTKRGFGKAVVELSPGGMPNIVDKPDAREVDKAEDSVPGSVEEEPKCVSVPWSGTVGALFE